MAAPAPRMTLADVVQPEFPWWSDTLLSEGKPVPEGFSYSSETNTDKLDVAQVRDLLTRLGLLQ